MVMLPTEVIKRTRIPFALYSPAGDVKGAAVGEGLVEGLIEGLGDDALLD
jgi:hypothetical protein